MNSLKNFDWFVDQIADSLDQESKQALSLERDYLLTLRNEDERRRHVEEIIVQTKRLIKKRLF